MKKPKHLLHTFIFISSLTFWTLGLLWLGALIGSGEMTKSPMLMFLGSIFSMYFGFLSVDSLRKLLIKLDAPCLLDLEKGKPVKTYEPRVLTLAYWDIILIGHQVRDPDGQPIFDHHMEPTISHSGLTFKEAVIKTEVLYEMLRQDSSVLVRTTDGSVWCGHQVLLKPSEEAFDTPPHPKLMSIVGPSPDHGGDEDEIPFE